MPKCRQAPETPAHMLNVCTPNTVLKHLDKATNRDKGTIFIDQAIQGASGILRPNLVVRSEDTITMIDVTIPMETAFDTARAEKKQKYSEIVQWARS